MNTPPALRNIVWAAAPLLLAACSGLGPTDPVESRVVAQWQAPLPHQGSVGSLTDWWQAHGDPLLVELIRAAQDVSPSVSSALARVESARAQQVAAQALLLPDVSAQTAARRGVALPGAGQATRTEAGLQASWEIDMTGANRAASRAAQGRFEATQAQWHDARVSVAAEVAKLYYSLSTCQRQVWVAQQDASSRRETARLTELSTRAGLSSRATTAMARASAAEANSRLTQQKAQCDLYVKAMVGLTALAEPELRSRLEQAGAHEPQPAPFAIASIPVQAISQRPDVFAAEREVVFAGARVGTARAARYPRLSLDGSIAAVRLANDGVSQDFSLWSFGPLTLSLPLYDGGQRAASVTSAEAAYRDAIVAYQGSVRQAVREVEEALVVLRSTEERLPDTLASSEGYAQALAATQVRYANGLASLLELEDGRRSALAADNALLSVKLERLQAWVTLYRAVGGGFEPGKTAMNPADAAPAAATATR